MASKLIALASHEAPNQLELSLREAYTLFLPQLTPPLKLTILSPQQYLTINRAILYGVLCEPSLAKTHIKYLHAIVNDGYYFFVKLLSQIVDELYSKMLESPKVQLLWVASVMVDVSGIGFDRLLVSLLRQIVGGDFSDGNLWLSYELVNLFLSKWDLLLAEETMVLTCALYTYLRLLADHYRLPRNPRLIELKRIEIGFCVRMLREQFHLCLRIGRDLIRLLQDLAHVPEVRSIWKDLVLNPCSFGTPGFSDISVVYGMWTPSRYILLRTTPEMETQLRFLLTHVKLGTQKRHQAWFARKFLFAPERETLISDMVRFICASHHPSNEVLQSDVIPRWAVVGWLLKSCTKKYNEANAKLALFYDWLFFDEKVDNVMNVEPAMLLMVNSIPRYTDMTNSLLEFLLLLIDNYDIERKSVIVKGVSSALSMLVRKGVVESLEVLTSCKLLSPFVKEMLQNLMLKPGILKEPQPPKRPLSDVPSPMLLDPIPTPNSDIQFDNVANLIGKIGENMKRSSKMGQRIVEKVLLLYLNPGVKSGKLSSEFLACEVKKELELAGYKLFSPVENLPKSVDTDDEMESVTAAVIQIFIFSQHERIQEMLLCWSRSSCHVRARLLSYALRLAYEAHVAAHGENHTSEINYDKMMPLLKCHVEGYFAFTSKNDHNVNGGIPSNFKLDKKLISEMIDGAFNSYRIMVIHTRDAFDKDLDMSPGKVLSTDVISCSLWKNKKFRVLFYSIFSHLSDLSLGDLDVIRLLVSQMEDADLVSIQIDVGLKRFSIFGEDVQNTLQLIRRSVCWEQLEQHKFWGLIRSEFSVSKFPVEKLVLDCFFSADLDPKANDVIIGELLTLCSCHAPTPELVGAIMLLPENKFPDFAAAVLSHWVVINASMLFNSIAGFLDKLEKQIENIALDLGGIALNQSAVLFLLNYLESQGIHSIKMVDELAFDLSDIKRRLGNSSVAKDGG